MLPVTFVLSLWFGPAPALTLPDLEFMVAVEESVMAEPGLAPPEPCKGLIERLGSDSYRDREAASRSLWVTSRFNQRWLAWGRRYRDPEIRLRSNTILRRINPCPTCKGEGRSVHYREDPCFDCGGSGSRWPYSAWD